MLELCTPILYAYPLLVTSIFVWEIHQDSSGFIISWYDCVLADIHFIYYYIFQTWFLNLYFNEHQNKLKMGNCTLLTVY